MCAWKASSQLVVSPWLHSPASNLRNHFYYRISHPVRSKLNVSRFRGRKSCCHTHNRAVSFPGPERLPVHMCIDNSANFFDEMSPRPALCRGLVGAGCWTARTTVPPVRH